MGRIGELCVVLEGEKVKCREALVGKVVIRADTTLIVKGEIHLSSVYIYMYMYNTVHI